MKNQPLFLRLIAAVLLLGCLFSTVGCAGESNPSSLASVVSVQEESSAAQSSIVPSDTSSEDKASEVIYDTIPFTLGFTGVSLLDSTLEFEAKLIKNVSTLHSQIEIDEEASYFEEFNDYVDSIDQAFFKEKSILAIIIFVGSLSDVPQVNFLAWSEQGLIVDYTIVNPHFFVDAGGYRLILLEVENNDLNRRPLVILQQYHSKDLAYGEYYDFGPWEQNQ